MSNELKNDIRFIAVGAAGANVVKMLERKDYKSYYINDYLTFLTTYYNK